MLTEMNPQQKMTMRSKLATLLTQVKSLRSDLKELAAEHAKINMNTLVTHLTSKTAIALKQRPTKLSKFDAEDKQNQFNSYNMAINQASVNKSGKKNKNYIKLQHKQETIQGSSLTLIKSKRNQINDIRQGLFTQLGEIKCMEKRSEAMRRMNQKIKQYNSNQKKSYRNSVSRDKVNSRIHMRSENGELIKSNLTQSHLNTDLTNLQFCIDVNLRSECSTLRCPKGHQYYDGGINTHNQPHGSGRLEMCCKAIPLQAGCMNINDCLFYQGQFKDGKFHGFGTLSYRGGVKYVGEFKEGKRQGKGSMYYNGKAQVANWDNDLFISIM